MSEWHVRVVELGEIKEHENADRLQITYVDDYPVIIRKDSFGEGDKAVYVPIDSVVPLDDPRFSFLDKERIRALKLRGVFSMGLLVPADESMEVGDIVHEKLGITKYVPPEPMSAGDEDEPEPGFFAKFTDIEGLRRYPNIFAEGEEVVFTEKVHGACARFLFRENRLWIGSRTAVKKLDASTMWNTAAKCYQLEEKLSSVPNIAIYGEVYGRVQSLRYGLGNDRAFIAFDALDTNTRKYLDYDDFLELMTGLEIPVVPELYRGPWNREKADELSNGKSLVGGDHIREGIVIRPVKERFHDEVGRVVLKYIGEEYLLQH